jgi:small subunit ribosomal protein S2
VSILAIKPTDGIPKCSYIYSEVNNIHILDLVQSATLLKEANSYVKSASSEGKTFLFVGTKRQASFDCSRSKACDSYYINHRWLGGMLTNWTTLTERIQRFKNLEQQEADNTFNLLTKKEATLCVKRITKVNKHLEGIKNMYQILDYH